jgi:transcription elongation factor GreA
VRRLGERAETQSRPRPPALLMTSAGLERLQGELAQLRRRVNEEMSQRLREARSYGDGSNNDEYHAVREDQMVLEARIASLEDTVARAEVLDEEAAVDGVAIIGSTVSIEDLASGARTRHRLADAHSADRGVISAASPMGRALIGATPGTVVTVDLPRGRSRSLRVIAVERSETVREAA